MAVIEYTQTNVYAKTLAAKIQMDRTSTAVRLHNVLLDGGYDDMLKLANSFRVSFLSAAPRIPTCTLLSPNTGLPHAGVLRYSYTYHRDIPNWKKWNSKTSFA